MALPYVTAGQLEQLIRRINDLEKRVKELESKPTETQKIVVGENSDGTVSMSIED